MISTFRLGLIFSFNFILLYGLFGQATTVSFSERLREIRERSSQHENQVASLLAQPSIKPVDYNNISPPPPPAPAPAPAPSSVPLVDGDGSAVPVNQVPKENMIVEPVESDSVKLVEVTESNSTSNKPNEELDDAYAKLYEPDVPSRLQGYYFGPLLGLVFPQDGAIRFGGNPMESKDYEADSGFLLGLQAGKDFGSVRVEAEYTYHNFDASSPTFSLSASIHNFFGRLILEKEIGDRFDLRFGLGMGMGIVGMESSVASTDDHSGTGFAYDFLLGTSYRLSDNWSLQADYRYYLTAAHDNYDHVKSHLWLLSASLDL